MMKVLIDSFGPPAFLAHGGATTQVHETVRGLRELGVEVDFVRWWDKSQTGDIIHAFGVPNSAYIEFAKLKGIPIVNTTLFTATCNRPERSLNLQGAMVSTLLKIPSIPPWGSIRSQLKWSSYRKCDMNVVGLEAEAKVLRKVYSVPESKIKILPLGLSEIFLNAGHGDRSGDHLITTGTITERKRSLELATMAKHAKVPILFVGKPYDETEAYWKKFAGLIDGKYVKHIGHTDSVEEMVELLKTARGYVLGSDYENWCLSAHEAIACGLPILVPDQPWSRELFAEKASYFTTGSIGENTERLASFYASIDSLSTPDIRLFSWQEVAQRLIEIYKDLLASVNSSPNT